MSGVKNMPERRVLVVDDDEGIVVLLTDVLETMGLEVTTAPNGASGLEKVRAQPFDLVITDILMPEEDGISLVQQIRSECCDVPIIAISGGGNLLPSHWGLKMTQAFGADAILHKPFQMKELTDKVRELLA